MPDDTASTGSNGNQSQDTANQSQDTGNSGGGGGGGQQGGSPGPAPEPRFQAPEGGARPGVDDRSAENMLADAVNTPAGDGGDGDGEGDQSGASTGNDDIAAARAEADKWKAHARTWEKRAKEYKPRAEQYDQYAESQKTEQQKLTDAANAAEARAKEAEGRLARTMAAATYDLPPALIDYLRGESEDDINASAEALASAINERASTTAAAAGRNGDNGQQQPRRGAANRPVESLRPGGMPAGESVPRDANAWFRELLNSRNS